MKSINQIFKGNEHLLDEKSVSELVDYCKDLEDEIVENNQMIDQTVILKQLIYEIKTSCDQIIKDDEQNQRWPNDFEKVDFKEAIFNLRKYISTYCQDNKIRL